ncbi:TPA: hypothetical protein N0F65_011339 [Lagenidium giganteum]|uniref:Phosphodiesterase n=1 Tax=Lagenidium giganteum TaxID=4803 RepID=A0AAV2Z3R4_9STRA|nr:TPA: hypothetical protein N0F65_011339 [Lagenidium giganteum]
MVRVLLDYLVTQMDAAACAVFLIDQNSNVMSRISRGHASISGIEPGKGIVGFSLQSKQPYCRQDFEEEFIFDAEIDLLQDFDGQKLYSVPLLDNGNVYAIIQVTSSARKRRSELDDLDLKLLAWLGPILSSCMRKCIEFHDVLLSERTQKALLHIISSSDTEDTVLNLVDGVIAGACHITKAERLSLFMVDWETNELWALSSSYHDENLRVPVDKSILGVAAKTRSILNVNDLENDPNFDWEHDQRDGIETHCALYVPVGVQNNKSPGNSRPIAVLEIINKDEGSEFTLDDECAFEAFASEVAVILRRRSNEIEYIKLLADTRAEKVLAQRAKSQVNLLECYTSYSSTMKGHAADRLRHSFSKSHSRQCIMCGLEDIGLHPPERHNSVMTPRLGYKFQSRPDGDMQNLALGPRIPSWDFNVFTASTDSLLLMIEDIFLDFNLDELLSTSKLTMRNFIMATKEKYHPNPFHNFLHAVSVLHASYLLLSTTDASQMLMPLDIAGCLIASLCHDLDHPGHTNAFEVMTGSQLALLYADESVLERHHAYTTFRVMKEKNANVLQGLSKPDYRHIRKVIITAILGTDMANHFKFCETLEKVLHPLTHQISSPSLASVKRDSSKTLDITPKSGSKNKSTSEILNVLREAVFQNEGSVAGTPASLGRACSNASNSTKSPRQRPHGRRNGWVFNGTLDERIFLVKTIVHASDLSGQVFPKPVALKWSNMITKEFAYQALLEQAEGLSVSYQHLDDPLQMVEGQHFFAQKIVAPLWDLMYVMFPEVECCMDNLSKNIAHYEQELERLKNARQIDEPLPEEEAKTIMVSQDEGVAVPGLARCVPAKFNSFLVYPHLRSDGGSETGELSDGNGSSELLMDVIEAVNMSRVSSLTRSRSQTSLSQASVSSGEEYVDEEVEVVDVDRVEADEAIFRPSCKRSTSRASV